jgi:hypothetical protein
MMCVCVCVCVCVAYIDESLFITLYSTVLQVIEQQINHHSCNASDIMHVFGALTYLYQLLRQRTNLGIVCNAQVYTV